MKKANLFFSNSRTLLVLTGLCMSLSFCSKGGADKASQVPAYNDTPAVYNGPSEYEGLLISKLFFSAEEDYFRDCYIRLTNNSDAAMNVAGVVVLESKFTCASDYYDFNEPIDGVIFVTQVVYRIPGESVILPPDSSLILADLAIDHADIIQRDSLPDLSNADFQWSEDTISTAPLMDKVFSYSKSYWQMHTRGYRAYAIAKIPDYISDDDFLAEFKYEGTYWVHIPPQPSTLPTDTMMTTKNAYWLDYKWIIDAVCTKSPEQSKRILQVIPMALDAGYTYVGTAANPGDYHHNSVTRRRVNNVPDVGKFVDTDNSTNDFVPNTDSRYPKNDGIR